MTTQSVELLQAIEQKETLRIQMKSSTEVIPIVNRVDLLENENGQWREKNIYCDLLLRIAFGALLLHCRRVLGAELVLDRPITVISSNDICIGHTVISGGALCNSWFATRPSTLGCHAALYVDDGEVLYPLAQTSARQIFAAEIGDEIVMTWSRNPTTQYTSTGIEAQRFSCTGPIGSPVHLTRAPVTSFHCSHADTGLACVWVDPKSRLHGQFFHPNLTASGQSFTRVVPTLFASELSVASTLNTAIAVWQSVDEIATWFFPATISPLWESYVHPKPSVFPRAAVVNHSFVVSWVGVNAVSNLPMIYLDYLSKGKLDRVCFWQQRDSVLSQTPTLHCDFGKCILTTPSRLWMINSRHQDASTADYLKLKSDYLLFFSLFWKTGSFWNPSSLILDSSITNGLLMANQSAVSFFNQPDGALGMRSGSAIASTVRPITFFEQWLAMIVGMGVVGLTGGCIPASIIACLAHYNFCLACRATDRAHSQIEQLIANFERCKEMWNTISSFLRPRCTSRTDLRKSDDGDSSGTYDNLTLRSDEDDSGSASTLTSLQES